MRKLSRDFYKRDDVVTIARELLGKIIVTEFEGKLTSARIVETEAYVALTDKASHSYAGKRTARNEAMYSEGGTVYVYICYGMHHLFNVVTNAKNVPDAVLIRAAEPLQGIDIMQERTGSRTQVHTLTKGPGKMSKALGISKSHSGTLLSKGSIYLADDGYEVSAAVTGTSKRIGIDGAGIDAMLPYRFFIKGNPSVSGYPNK